MRFQSKGSHCVWRSFELIVHNLLISFLQSHNGTSVDCISAAIHGDRHNQIYRSGKGSTPMINVSNAQPISSAFVSISPFYGFVWRFWSDIVWGGVVFGWEYSESVPLWKRIICRLSYFTWIISNRIAQFVNGPAVTIAFLDLCVRHFSEMRIVFQ